MTQIASELSAALAAAVEKAQGSVVRVRGRRRAPSSGVVASADGVVVTAQHSLEWEENIEVGLPDGRTAGATLVGRDPTTDLAALRLESGASPASAPWAEVEGVRAGSLVLAVSRPGRSARASLGVVSVKGGSWRTPGGGRLDHYLETDVARYPGLSGSALVDASGNVIGLNTSGLVRGAVVAITSSTVRRVVAALLAHGEIRRGFLGIGTYPVRLPAPIAQQAGQAAGLLLLSVEAESPAGRAGLLLGDVLVALDGVAVTHPSDLLPLLEDDRIGREVVARILRGGQWSESTITIGVRPSRSSPA